MKIASAVGLDPHDSPPILDDGYPGTSGDFLTLVRRIFDELEKITLIGYVPRKLGDRDEVVEVWHPAVPRL